MALLYVFLLLVYRTVYYQSNSLKAMIKSILKLNITQTNAPVLPVWVVKIWSSKKVDHLKTSKFHIMQTGECSNCEFTISFFDPWVFKEIEPEDFLTKEGCNLRTKTKSIFHQMYVHDCEFSPLISILIRVFIPWSMYWRHS